MGAVLSKLVEPVSKADNDRWLGSISPIKGELRAAMVGVAAGAFFHESRFGLKWEREQLMIPLQRWWSSAAVSQLMHTLSLFADELMVPYFAVLYWCLDKFKCVYGIWLVPISEIVNGCMKWYFAVPRPGWVDSRVQMRGWSHEYSFPSSHSQIIWALATFFSGTSVGMLREKLYGSAGTTMLAYWWFLLGPPTFAALVSISRVHEGVHYPRDISVGCGIGVGLASVYMRFLPAIRAFMKRRHPAVRYALLQSLSLVAARACNYYYGVAQRKGDDPSKWCATAIAGNPTKWAGKDLNPLDTPMSGYKGCVPRRGSLRALLTSRQAGRLTG